jgi:hypothetical protein
VWGGAGGVSGLSIGGFRCMNDSKPDSPGRRKGSWGNVELQAAGADIRMIQGILRHRALKTTLVCTHGLNSGLV